MFMFDHFEMHFWVVLGSYIFGRHIITFSEPYLSISISITIKNYHTFFYSKVPSFLKKKIIFVLMFTTHHLGRTKIEFCQFMFESCQLSAKFRNSSHHTNIFNAESTTEFKFICQSQTLSQRSTPLMNWLRSHLPSNNSSEFRLACPKN